MLQIPARRVGTGSAGGGSDRRVRDQTGATEKNRRRNLAVSRHISSNILPIMKKEGG